MGDDPNRVYYLSKEKITASYNFDVAEATKDFSFYSFVNNSRLAMLTNKSMDFSAFLICTPKQYVVGYTSNFGSGAHKSAFGRAMKDILGGGRIGTTEEMTHYVKMCNKKYLLGTITYDCVGVNDQSIPVLTGGIILDTDRVISERMYESFKKFCEDYNADIDLAIKSSNGEFYISYYDVDKRIGIKTDNLEEVLNYLSSHISRGLIDGEDDEVIIGVDTRNRRLNMEQEH